MTRQLHLLKTLLLGAVLLGGASSAWAGDFIDEATTIKVANTETTATSGDKKTLTFTPSSVEIALEFTFTGKTVTPGQIFGVVEYSGTGTNTGNCRFRNLTLNNGNGATEIEEGKKAGQLTFTVDGNTVVLCPFLQNDLDNNDDKVMKTYYKNNVDKESLTLTYARAYVGGTSGTSMTLKRVGIYTLGEILELYPDLKTNNFQINDAFRLLNDKSKVASSKTNDGSTNGEIATNAAITDVNGCKLFVKAVDHAKLPENYVYFWYRFLQPSSPIYTDIFSDMKENQILMLSFGTGSNAHAVPNLPTMHKKLIDFDRNMFNYTFVDGVAPGSCEKVDVKGSQSTNYATYSRELKAGYNSCAMPFKKIASSDDVPSGITFYKVSSLTDNTVKFEKISDPTGNNTFTDGTNWTPVIIHAETAGVYTFVGRDAITDWSGITYKAKVVGGSNNQLNWVGSFVDEVPTGDYASTVNYGITSDGASFAKMGSGVKTTYYRAFLADSRSGASARALSLSFDDGNGTTEIVSPDVVDGLQKTVIYDLQGRRVAQPTRGLYIVNGKKVMIK